MDTKLILLTISFLIFSTSCSNKGDELNAIRDLSKARKEYYANNLASAEKLLDSLAIKYPYAKKSINTGNLLRDSILRTMSRNKIDSISELINNFKIEIIENRINNKTSIALEQKIDSLENIIIPFRENINRINGKELEYAAKTQCITCIRSLRN